MSPASTLDRTSWPHALLDLLHKQRVMVDELAQLAESQAALIAESHTDRLLDLLARRQILIDQFTASQVEVAGLTTGLDHRLESVSAAQRDRIKTLISEISERLAHIMRRDEQDQVSLCSTRDLIKNEMSSLGTARQARSAYVGSPAMNRYADQRG